MPLASIQPHRPDSSRLCSSANIIEATPSITKNTMRTNVRERTPLNGRNRSIIPAIPVGQWPRLNNAAPSLQPHYRAFNATTGCSAPALRFGTLALAVGAACGLSLHAVSVTQRRFSRSIRKPGRASRRLHAGCRSGRIRASPELIPEEGSPPGSDIA